MLLLNLLRWLNVLTGFLLGFPNENDETCLHKMTKHADFCWVSLLKMTKHDEETNKFICVCLFLLGKVTK